MIDRYLEVASFIERLHRQFLEVVRLELEVLGIYDINNGQAMLLFNIGDAEMTIGELTLRGRYLKTNVSYNVKKMVESGYIAYERSVHDRRLVYVRLTVKGRALHRQLITIFQRHTDKLRDTAIKQTDLEEVAVTLRRLEEFWLRAAIDTPRPGVSAA